MASTFNGDQSYSKLPPIQKGSIPETHCNGPDEHPSSFRREAHGLVRLPPIIRVDGSIPTPDLVYTDTESDNIQPRFTSKSKKDDPFPTNSYNTENIRNKGSTRRSESQKRQTVPCVTSNFNEIISDSHLDQDDARRRSISNFEVDKSYGYSRRLSKPGSLLNTNEYKRRRGSLVIPDSEKPLHRGRRLAKSSPDLSSTRKQYISPTRKTDKIRVDSERFQTDDDSIRAATDHRNLRRANKLKTVNRHGTLRRQSLKNTWETPPQPQSSPCTPVIQLTNDFHQQRNSLGDIYTVSSNERKPETFSRKKLLAREEHGTSQGLMVEGKTCRQNERLTSRLSSHRPSDTFLKIPQKQTKRDSLYDLGQILSLLNKESKSMNAKSPDATRKKSTSSVYDLKEFLEMSRPTSDSASNTDDTTKTSINKPELLSSLGIEKSAHRKGSTYDLLEFLSLNLKAGGQDQSDKQNDPNSPSHFLFPVASSETNTTQSVEARRPSAYDLMEFLSLSRQNNDNTATKSNNVNGPQTSSQSLTPNTSESQDSNRKNSVYDLEEFLNLSGMKNNAPIPKAPDKESGPLLSPRLPSTLKVKRESIYDLQEFLGILQKNSAESGSKNNPVNSMNEPNININQYNTKQLQRNDSESLKPLEEQPKGRSLSIYDLREFLSIYSAQQTQPNIANQLHRKPSEISQSSIMINVTEDEHGNGTVDDVFLAVPVEGGAGRKRSSIASVAELNELINIINDTTRKKTSSESPAPLARHDSGGARSLLDLGEFLSVLNSDDSPLRRRLSSVSDRGNRTPSSLSRNDSSGGSSLYDLEEFLAAINDSGHLRTGDVTEPPDEQNDEISIAVPQLPPRTDRTRQEQI